MYFHCSRSLISFTHIKECQDVSNGSFSILCMRTANSEIHMETIKTFFCLLPVRTRRYVVTGSSACLGHFVEVPSQLGILTESADPKPGSSAVCPPCVRRRGAQCVHEYFHLPAPPPAFFCLLSLIAHVLLYRATSTAQILAFQSSPIPNT